MFGLQNKTLQTALNMVQIGPKDPESVRVTRWSMGRVVVLYHDDIDTKLLVNA